MTDHTAIEAEIRRLIQTETHAVRLSNALFSPPDGLFCVIGMPLTEDERRVIGQSDLFRQAQAAVRRLQYRDAEQLTPVGPAAQTAAPTQPTSAPAESVGV